MSSYTSCNQKSEMLNSRPRYYTLVILTGFSTSMTRVATAIRRQLSNHSIVVDGRFRRPKEYSYSRTYVSEIVRLMTEYAFPDSTEAVGYCALSGKNCVYQNGGDGKLVVGKHCELAKQRRACRLRRPGIIIIFARRLVGFDSLMDQLRACAFVIPSDVSSSIENQHLGDSDVEHCVCELKSFLENDLPVLKEEMLNQSPSKIVPLLPLNNYLAKNNLRLVEQVMSNRVPMKPLFASVRKDFYDAKFLNPKTRVPGAFILGKSIAFQKDRIPHSLHVDQTYSLYPLNLLEAHYRFGVPYEEGFHYDVCKSKRDEPLHETFIDAYTGVMSDSTRSHLNITPTDLVRE